MLDFLHLNALWLIMDAWFPHPWPRDRERWPDIDQHNEITIDTICGYLHKLAHPAVSVAPQYTVNARLRDLPNTQNNLQELAKIMRERALQNIVYVGFHWGICLINKGDGARAVNQNYVWKLYTYRPLCSVFPGSDEPVMTRKMSRYMILL